MRANVFTIPPSSPFLETLCQALLKGQLIKDYTINPLSLAEITLYLPNRRLCREMTQLLIHKYHLTLLPNIKPMGEDDLFESLNDIPPAINRHERLMRLTKLIELWGVNLEKPLPLFESLALAQKLMRLLDQLITEEIPFEKITSLEILHDHAKYWQITLEFLKIITQFWPDILKELGLLEQSERRNRVLKLEALKISTLKTPVIAAGSTGSIKATRYFLKAVAQAQKGAVVLQGLDQSLSRDQFSFIDEDFGHPQYGLKRLIEALEVERIDGVIALGIAQLPERDRLINLTMLPATLSHLWQEEKEISSKSLENITLIETRDERNEALTLALLVRDALEKTRDIKIAIVTPDRSLAKRVKAELLRWNIALDDTAGTPLNQSSAFVFIRLFLNLTPLTPQGLLSFITHKASPFRDDARAIAALDLLALRGTSPTGFCEIYKRLETSDLREFPHPTSFLESDDRARAIAFLKEIEAFLLPTKTTFFTLISHINTHILPLINDDFEHKKEVLDFFYDISTNLCSKITDFPLALSDAETLILALSLEENLRPPLNSTANVRLYGLPEARAISADLTLLCGLNETIWPPQTESDPWISRSMGKALNLDPPERKIGLAAHDFTQLLGNKHVILSRSLKSNGNPTIASRWLQRLRAVISSENWLEMTRNGQKFQEIAAKIDHHLPYNPATRPSPTPPLEQRPIKLSVTEIEKLIRDPFAIYAKHILKLIPLDDYNLKAGARDLGIIMHDIFAKFTKKLSGNPSLDKVSTLKVIGDDAFTPFKDDLFVQTFWLPRFYALMGNFIATNEALRLGYSQHHAEIAGKMSLKLKSGREFTLTTRTDRIEQQGQSLKIYDYKTGYVPTSKMISAFFAPQMLLTALIAEENGYKNLPFNPKIEELAYLKVEKNTINVTTIKESEALMLETREKLTKLLSLFDQEVTPYLSKRMPMKEGEMGDYDQLARIDEWLSGDEDEE